MSKGISLQKRTIIWVLLATTLVLMCFGAVDCITTMSEMKQDIETSSEIVGSRLAKTLLDPVWNMDKALPAEIIIAEMGDKRIYAVLIRDRKGKIIIGKKRGEKWEPLDTDEDISGEFVTTRKKMSRENEDMGVVEIFYAEKFVNEVLMHAVAKILLRTLVLDIILVIILSLIIRQSMVTPLRSIIRSLTDVAGKVDIASSVLSKTSQQLAQNAGDQAATLEESSAGIEELSSMSHKNAGDVGEADAFMKQTTSVIRRSGQSMKDPGQSHEKFELL